MWAQVVDGAYFIQNVESGLFLCGANDWGTRACVADEGVEFNLTTISEGEGAYSIQHPLVTDSKKMLGSNLYTDSTTPTGGWKITAVTGEEGVYTIAYVTTSTVTDPETGKEQTVETANYLAQGTDVLAKGHPAISVTEVTDEAKWYILTKAQAIAKLSEATAENPLPATFLLKNPGFNRNLSTSAWTVDASNKNLSGGTNHNRCAESWRSTFTLTQTVELPNGHYKVRAQAALTDYTNAYDGTDYPVVYANDETVPFFSMEEADRGSNMNTLSNAFAAGTYTTDWIEVTVVDKKLSVGVKGTRTDTWCIWDNFQILYCGPLDLSAYATALSDALDAAKAVDQAAPMQATVLADLQAAIAAYDGVSYDNSDDYEAAVSALMDATNAANASIAVYATIKGYNDKVAVLKGDAIADAYADVLAAYNAGTATEAETAKAAYIDALKVAAPVVDITDLAPASWTGATGTVAANFMKQPEYVGIAERYQSGAFTGDVMTQTITGLQNGTYKVILHGGASYTSGRGFEGATGQNHAYFFANDALQSLEVYDRTVIADGSVEEAVLICGVTDGTLKYGIQNITIGANWFVVDLESISFESTSLPAIDVTLAVGDSKYATFIAPFEYTVPAGVQAYTIDAVNANGIDLVMSEKTTVPANTPVVLYAESPVSTIVSGVSEAAGMNYTVGLLTGVYGDLEITEGYVLQNQDGEVKFYAVSTDNPITVPAYHAYLTAPTAGVKAFGFDAIATAIAKIEAEKAQKAGIYNLQGQRVNTLQRGINIVNGKKVLVK